MRNEIFLSSALAASMLLAAPAFPQSPPSSVSDSPDPLSLELTPPGRAPNWGTSSSIVAIKTAVDFTPYAPSGSWGVIGGSPNRYAVAGVLVSGIFIPAGAKVIAIELEACDTSSTGQIDVVFAKQSFPSDGGTIIDSVSTGTAATPGCSWFSKTLTTPEVIDNYNIPYWFQVGNTVSNGSVSFSAVRAYYQLQVSPKPGAATFSDVPLTHPFSQFVEALVSAGITAGCTTTAYCPDAPVTRGQMAVFLSRALGLHWPN